MGLFSSFSDFLTGSVGNNLDNDEGDVRNTKRNLKNTDHLDNDDVENGYVTREMDNGIKSFQRDNGLKIDGALLPGGETERGLFGTLTGRSADTVFGRKSEKNDGDIIGFGGNVSGISERKKPTYKRPKYSTVFVPPLESKKEEAEKDNSFTLTRGGIGVNKDKIADGIEKFLLEAGQGEEAPAPANKSNHEEEEKSVQESELLETNLPVPKHKPSILAGVSDKAIKNDISSHENIVLHLYKDSGKDGGFVTVGYGSKINNIEEAKQLPFEIKDKNGKFRRAKSEEIEQAFKKIEAIKNKNNIASAFEPSVGKLAKKHNLDNLMIPKEEAERLLDKNLREHARIIRQKFKNRDMNFDGFPPSAQKLFLDLQFNTGLDLDGVWKNLRDAAKQKNWDKIKQEMNRPQIGSDRKKWALKQLEAAKNWEK